jgi:hypothetical protein
MGVGKRVLMGTLNRYHFGFSGNQVAALAAKDRRAFVRGHFNHVIFNSGSHLPTSIYIGALPEVLSLVKPGWAIHGTIRFFSRYAWSFCWC